MLRFAIGGCLLLVAVLCSFEIIPAAPAWIAVACGLLWLLAERPSWDLMDTLVAVAVIIWPLNQWALVVMLSTERPSINAPLEWFASSPQYALVGITVLAIRASVPESQILQLITRFVPRSESFVGWLRGFFSMLASKQLHWRRAQLEYIRCRPRRILSNTHPRARLLVTETADRLAEGFLQILSQASLQECRDNRAPAACPARPRAPRLRLDEVYELPYFNMLTSRTYAAAPIPDAWHAQLVSGADRYTAMLDLGCGSGRFAQVAAQLGYHVVAVDKLLTAPATKPCDPSWPGIIEWIRDDIMNWETEPRFVIAILAQNSLLEIINEVGMHATFARLAYLLKVGSRLVVDHVTDFAVHSGVDYDLYAATEGNVRIEYLAHVIAARRDLDRTDVDCTLQLSVADTCTLPMQITSNCELAFSVPSLDAIVAAAQRHGFRMKEATDIPASQAHTFLPGRMRIIVFEKA